MKINKTIFRNDFQYVLLLFISLYLTYPFLLKGLSFFLQIATYGGCFYLIIKKLYILKQRVRKANNFQYLQRFLISFVIIIWFTLIYPILFSTTDYSYVITLTNGIKCIFRFLAIYILACSFYKRNITNIEYYNIFIIVNCLYVCSTFIFLLIPSLREFWNSILYSPATENFNFENVAEYITRYGLQGFSGFINTGYCAIAFIFNLYIIEKNRINKIFKKSNILFLFILLIGCMCYGRIGLLITLGFSLGYLLFLIIVKGKIKLIIYCTFIIIILISIITIVMKSNDQFRIWFDWAYEPFINYFSGNTFESASSNQLKEMWELPSVETFLWGDGRYTDPISGSYYKQTDVGYLRNIYFFGLFPTITCIYCFYCCTKAIQPEKILNKKDHYFILIILWIGLFIEAKGEFILSLSGVLFPLFFTTKMEKFKS